MPLQGLVGRGGWRIAPERLDQSLRGRAARSAWSRNIASRARGCARAGRHVDPAVNRLEPSQDPEVHASRQPSAGHSGTRYRRVTGALPRSAAGCAYMAMDAGLRRLSLREARVARLVGEGLSDEQVAERLGIDVVRRERSSWRSVFRKLGLRSRTELALLAPDGPGAPHRRRTTNMAEPGVAVNATAP